MDAKTLHVLEYPKILARLGDFCDFSASADLARTLHPTPDFEEAIVRLTETSEARTLLVTSNLTIGGAHDIREQVDLAAHGGVLDPKELLEVQSTLVSMRDLHRFFDKHAEASPHLADIACRLPAPAGLIDAITRCIADNGEVADSASPRLYDLRRQVRVAHDRLMSRLQRYLTDSSTASKLQDAVITQRDGRYVIPLRAEFKGQVKAIVHDQSSTGATLFVEPLAVVELNNAFREAQIAERDEVRRVLAELSAQVGELAGEIVPGVAALAELDLAFAKAKYADEIQANEPILHSMMNVKRRKPASPMKIALGYSIFPRSNCSMHGIRCSTRKRWCPSRLTPHPGLSPSSSPVRTRAARPSRSRPSACWWSWPRAGCTSRPSPARNCPASRPFTPTSATSSPSSNRFPLSQVISPILSIS